MKSKGQVSSPPILIPILIAVMGTVIALVMFNFYQGWINADAISFCESFGGETEINLISNNICIFDNVAKEFTCRKNKCVWVDFNG